MLIMLNLSLKNSMYLSFLLFRAKMGTQKTSSFFRMLKKDSIDVLVIGGFFSRVAYLQRT
ncbi:hypothetical protein D3C76_1787070 [compost metagenome]